MKNSFSTIEEAQKHYDKQMRKQNSKGIPEFEGYSPNDMYWIINFTFQEGSPVQMRKLTETEYDRIPIFRQVRHLAQTLLKEGEIKLTAVGNLPVRIVAELYPLGVSDWWIEYKKTKLIREKDSESVHLAMILIELMGVAKKRKKVLSLTKTGAKVVSDNIALLALLIDAFSRQFNWAYFDGYGENKVGQLGFGFSLILLGKYGSEKHDDKFYAGKYFAAFPMLMGGLVPSYDTVEHEGASCYSIRTFERFLLQLGLITIEQENKLLDEKIIVKTEIFDRLFKILPVGRA